MDKIYIVYGPDPSGVNPWESYPLKYYEQYEDAYNYAYTVKDAYVSMVKMGEPLYTKKQLIDELDHMVGNKISAALLYLLSIRDLLSQNESLAQIKVREPEKWEDAEEVPTVGKTVSDINRVLEDFCSQYYKIRCK